MKTPVPIGPWVRGIMEADAIEPKTIASRSRIHDSTLSRYFNGVLEVPTAHAVLIGIAIGEIRNERRKGVR